MLERPHRARGGLLSGVVAQLPGPGEVEGVQVALVLVGLLHGLGGPVSSPGDPAGPFTEQDLQDRGGLHALVAGPADLPGDPGIQDTGRDVGGAVALVN